MAVNSLVYYDISNNDKDLALVLWNGLSKMTILDRIFNIDSYNPF